MKLRNIPNLISILRIILVIPVVVYLLLNNYALALLLFMVAGLSDAVDGYLAKQYDWESRTGAILDPLADKFLLVSCYLVLGWLGQLPAWLVIVVIVRDVVIVAGALCYHWLVERFEMVPSMISKTNTVCQIILILAVLFSLGLYPVPEWMLQLLIYTVLATTLISGLGYVGLWGRRSYDKLHMRQ